MPKGVEHSVIEFTDSIRQELHPSLMPKGVEHLSSVSPLSGQGGLHPSLMPKGVEHQVRAWENERPFTAPISDAERR